MKRSVINAAILKATAFFGANGWTLPPAPRWDVTDFGLGDFRASGLVLVNLAEEAEYCEKLMYADRGQVTPSHTHQKKKEDIICRAGVLAVQLWKSDPWKEGAQDMMVLKVNGAPRNLASGDKLVLQAGERVTIEPGIWHEFWPESEQCIIGEVSTANDDLNDNFFSNNQTGRYAEIEEDEPALIRLLSDK
ncbi:D-lyxose/D-mannose family sugar isomerase [Pedobacter sp. JY14-1]|uniref:D-lyxose/D-mannose family sugar isomerase n=1 Tax=Pedobacter sp. JY14-1 TaxID=3034151 RepID=UPI0023E1C45C|nr:D-lyxose/D-mannose family sugar isomerase [Pedobacter sp. JY14-1]